MKGVLKTKGMGVGVPPATLSWLGAVHGPACWDHSSVSAGRMERWMQLPSLCPLYPHTFTSSEHSNGWIRHNWLFQKSCYLFCAMAPPFHFHQHKREAIWASAVGGNPSYQTIVLAFKDGLCSLSSQVLPDVSLKS